jgi:hypothetical protein
MSPAASRLRPWRRKTEIAFSFFVPMVVAGMPDPSDQSGLTDESRREPSSAVAKKNGSRIEVAILHTSRLCLDICSWPCLDSSA